jgi:CheY-like chemotaxis protein
VGRRFEALQPSVNGRAETVTTDGASSPWRGRHLWGDVSRELGRAGRPTTDTIALNVATIGPGRRRQPRDGINLALTIGVSSNETKSSLNGLRVLIVDDDPASAKLEKVVLESEGGDVQVAGSAEAALDVVETFNPRVIVLDLVLPRMSGLLLAEHLKAKATTKDIVLVAVSAFDGRETQLIAQAAGCRAYLRKPIDPATFPGWVLANVAANG